MTSEKYNLGLIPIFYLFLSGSTGREQEFSDEQFSNNGEIIENTSPAENGWMKQSTRDEKRSGIRN